MSEIRNCIITAAAAGKGRYHWSWRSTDGARRSRSHYLYFYDCVTDARANGCQVEIEAVVSDLKAAARAAEARRALPDEQLNAAA